MLDAWKEIATGFAGLWLTLASFIGVREIKRIDGKADRAELDRLIRIMEERDKEDRENRKALYQRIDNSIENQERVNRELVGQVNRLMGRVQ